MKTFTTTQGNKFTVDHAQSLFAGSGHQKITVYLESSEYGEFKIFCRTTSNMPAFDRANDLTGQDKYEALFQIVGWDLEDLIDEWINELKEDRC